MMDIPDDLIGGDYEETPTPICCYGDEMQQNPVSGKWVCPHCFSTIEDNYNAIIATHEPDPDRWHDSCDKKEE